MKVITSLSIFCVCLMIGCSQLEMKELDIQGHRGARGVLPENTIPSFIYALEAGVTTLELDVVVSADGKLVVSHEPWMSAEICSHPDGTPVSKKEELSLNLYKMSYDSILKYDCGSRGNARFPQQMKMAVSKPLLSEVIDTIEKLIIQKKLNPVYYNIETKSELDGDNVYHPEPEVFAKLLFDEIKKHRIENKAVVQSFDERTLQVMRRIAPQIQLALLVAEGELESSVAALGFTPEIYSPNYHLVNELLIKLAHERGMKVIPWTVNDAEEMKKLIAMGVDGIITDYPDRAMGLILIGR